MANRVKTWAAGDVPTYTDLNAEFDNVNTGDRTITGSLTMSGTIDVSTGIFRPRIYSQAAEPDIAANSMAFWKDTDDSKYYLILDIAGTQKKFELT